MTAGDSPNMSTSAGDLTGPLVVPLDGATAADRDLLGGKAASLVLMAALGVPVPPAFTLTTAACRRYQADGRQITELLWSEVLDGLGWLEDSTGQQFGGRAPLLVSVRSGAPVSMPGMMDTLLNVGLTRPMLTESGPGWLTELATGIRTSFADAPFAVLAAERGPDARAEALAQLRWAIARIFDSWRGERAETYRRANGIPGDLGTAVTVQAMVFGNRDDDSGTGVYITRNPATGANEPYGEWLPRAQGESLVSGERSPLELAAFQASMPELHSGLVADGRRLETAERYPVEIEFTVESGRLYFLQARRSTCTPLAAVHWAVDLVDEGLLEIADVIDWVDEDSLRALARAGGPAEITGRVLARGTGVVPGRCCALVVDDADEADRLAEEGSRVILARPRTSPHDVHGFLAAAGVITERGGSTSHAAVVARQIGLPCVVGCGEGTVSAVVGRVVTIDGTRGVVYDGVLPDEAEQAPAATPPELARLLRWRSAGAGGCPPSIRSSES